MHLTRPLSVTTSELMRDHGIFRKPYRKLQLGVIVFLIHTFAFSAPAEEKANFLIRLGTEKLWGVYQIHGWPDRFEAALDRQVAELGATPDLVMFFRDLPPRRGFPTQSAEIIRSRGAIPVLSLELHRWSRQRDDSKDWLQAIVEGELDEAYMQWAADAKDFGTPVLIRFGFEMNGDWFAWGNQSEKFKKAWQHVHGIVSEAGADNVIWVFSPNVEWDESKPETRIKLYYPGDAYVDVVALDGYNFGNDSKPWHTWQSYSEVFADSIDIMSQYPKPLILGEIGTAHGPNKADWLRDFLKRYEGDARVRGFIYYNFADGKNDEPNWRLNSDPESLRVFREFVAEE